MRAYIDPKIEIDMADVQTETFMVRGVGYSSIRRSESGVRLTHLLSGIEVCVGNQRSQLQNKIRARQVLTVKVYHLQTEQSQLQIIRRYDYSTNIALDMRLDKQLNLSEVLQGKLGQFINPFVYEEYEALFEKYGI